MSSCLTAENAASWSASQMNSLVCIRRGRSGVPTADNRNENSLHWLTRPRNDLRSVRLDGEEVADGCCLCWVRGETSGIQDVTAIVHLVTGEDKLLEAERDAVLSGTKQSIPDVSYMLPESLSMDKSVVHHLDEVVQVSEGSIGPSVVLVTGRDAPRVVGVLEATPRRDKHSQWLSSIRKWKLPIAMTGVHLCKPLGGADVRQ